MFRIKIGESIGTGTGNCVGTAAIDTAAIDIRIVTDKYVVDNASTDVEECSDEKNAGEHVSIPCVEHESATQQCCSFRVRR